MPLAIADRSPSLLPLAHVHVPRLFYPAWTTIALHPIPSLSGHQEHCSNLGRASYCDLSTWQSQLSGWMRLSQAVGASRPPSQAASELSLTPEVEFLGHVEIREQHLQSFGISLAQ